MFWIVAVVVLIVVVLGLMWRYDQRHRVNVDLRKPGMGEGQATGATYARPNVPPSSPSGF